MIDKQLAQQYIIELEQRIRESSEFMDADWSDSTFYYHEGRQEGLDCALETFKQLFNLQ